MLFLHGWCCDRRMLAPQFEQFSTTQRVAAPDLPGHGASSPPNEFTIEAAAFEVGTLARSLHLAPSVVVGHSMGALIALALSQQAPELVNAVVMVDPPPLQPGVWQRVANRLVLELQGPNGDAGRRSFINQLFLPTDDPERRAEITEIMCAAPNDVAISALDAMAAFDAASALHHCEAPILSIGSAVPTNDPAFLREANAAIVIGQTVGSGHFNQLEVPDQVNLMIERFLTVAPRGPRTTR